MNYIEEFGLNLNFPNEEEDENYVYLVSYSRRSAINVYRTIQNAIKKVINDILEKIFEKIFEYEINIDNIDKQNLENKLNEYILRLYGDNEIYINKNIFWIIERFEVN